MVCAVAGGDGFHPVLQCAAGVCHVCDTGLGAVFHAGGDVLSGVFLAGGMASVESL